MDELRKQTYDRYYLQAKQIKEEKKEIQEKIKELEARLENLNDLGFQLQTYKDNLDCIDSFYCEHMALALSYFVSLIEGKKYKSCVAPLGFKTSFNYPEPIDETCPYMNYHMLYLVEEEKEELASQEIKERFTLDFNRQEEAKEKIHAGLTTLSSNYIQIVFFSYDGVKYRVPSLNYTSLSEYSGHIFLCDEKYSYIRDFIDIMVHFRLCKQDNQFKITLKEMYDLADDYAKNYKKTLDGEARK